MKHRHKFITRFKTMTIKNKLQTNVKKLYTILRKVVSYFLLLNYHIGHIITLIISKIYFSITNYVYDWIDYFQREKNIVIYDLDYTSDDPILQIAIKNRRRRRTSFIEPEENIWISERS